MMAMATNNARLSRRDQEIRNKDGSGIQSSAQGMYKIFFKKKRKIISNSKGILGKCLKKIILPYFFKNIFTQICKPKRECLVWNQKYHTC